MRQLFTIGHSNHTIEHFIELLKRHQVAAVADVRSTPYSQFAPQFNREPLAGRLRQSAVEYAFLGTELGARRSEECCYVGDQAKYERIAELPAFHQGLERLMVGLERYRLALVCSELDPLTCHRTILVCRALLAICPPLEIQHILGDGSVESHAQAEERLIKLYKLQPELFGDLKSAAALAEKAYELQGQKIAYRRQEVEV